MYYNKKNIKHHQQNIKHAHLDDLWVFLGAFFPNLPTRLGASNPHVPKVPEQRPGHRTLAFGSAAPFGDGGALQRRAVADGIKDGVGVGDGDGGLE